MLEYTMYDKFDCYPTYTDDLGVHPSCQEPVEDYTVAWGGSSIKLALQISSQSSQPTDKEYPP